MTTSDLLLAIGETDECFVDEAGDSYTESYHESVGKHRWIVRWTGMVATILMLIGGALLYANGGRIFRKNANVQESSREAIIEENALEVVTQKSCEEEEGLGKDETASVDGSVENTFDVCRPTDEENLQDERIKTVMISSFAGIAGDEEATTAAVKISGNKAVENGNVWMSPSLSGAITYYGDREEYRYRVFVELFQNGSQIANDGEVAKKEVLRLAGLGYVVAMETCSDGETTQTYFTLHATADQVKDFVTDAEVGYALWLYDERVEANGNDPGTINVWYGTSSNANGSFEGKLE